jgi:4-amino-4-deoxy-L-arabinose transferase-like glycosyltransferase
VQDSPLPTLGRRHRLAAFVVIAIGAGLRFGAIGAGAPYRVANDEPFVVGMALQILKTGDFNPHFFDYGGLSIYLHTIVGVFSFLLGAIGGQWSRIDALWIGDLLPNARVVTAAMGTLTVFLVYRIGLRIGPQVALMAGFVMAVLPQHVRESHFALTDTPLTLLITATLLMSLRAVERGRVPAVVAAACMAGLAASVKYNGAVALIMPLTAALVLPAGSRLRGFGLALIGAGGAFLLTSPYTVLDLPGFLNGFGKLSQSYTQGRHPFEAAWIYLKYMRNWFSWIEVAPTNVGHVAVFLGVIGAALVVMRRGMTLTLSGAAIVLVFPCLWFFMLAEQGGLQYGRYLLPMMPMFCLCLGTALVALLNGSARFGSAGFWGLRAVVVALLVLPAGSAVGWVRDHAHPRTEELAAAWIVREVQTGQIVFVEAAAVALPPTIKAYFVHRLVDRPLEAYKKQAAMYLVTTSAETDQYFTGWATDPAKAAAYRDLVARTEPVAAFHADSNTLGPRISIMRVRP